MSRGVFYILAFCVIVSIFNIITVNSRNIVQNSDNQHRTEYIFNPLNTIVDQTFSLKGFIHANTSIIGIDNIKFIGTPETPIFQECSILFNLVQKSEKFESSLDLIQIANYTTTQFGPHSSFNSGSIELIELPTTDVIIQFQFVCQITKFQHISQSGTNPAVLSFEWEKDEKAIQTDEFPITFEFTANFNQIPQFNPALNLYNTHQFNSALPDPYLNYPSLNTTLPLNRLNETDLTKITKIRIQTLDTHGLINSFDDEFRFCYINGYEILQKDIEVQYWGITPAGEGQKGKDISAIDIILNPSLYKAIFGSSEHVSNDYLGVPFQFECNRIILNKFNSGIDVKIISQPTLNFIFLDQNDKLFTTFFMTKDSTHFDPEISLFPKLTIDTVRLLGRNSEIIVNFGFDYLINAVTVENFNKISSPKKGNPNYQFLNLTVSNCSPTASPSFLPAHFGTSIHNTDVLDFIDNNTSNYFSSTLTHDGAHFVLDLDKINRMGPLSKYELKLALDCGLFYLDEPIYVYSSYGYTQDRSMEGLLPSTINAMSIIHPVKPISYDIFPMKHKYNGNQSRPELQIHFERLVWPRPQNEVSSDIMHFKIEFSTKQYYFTDFPKSLNNCWIKSPELFISYNGVRVKLLNYTDDLNWNQYVPYYSNVHAFVFDLDKRALSNSSFDTITFDLHCDFRIIKDWRLSLHNPKDYLTVSTWNEQVQKDSIGTNDQNIFTSLRKSTVPWETNRSVFLTALYVLLAIGLIGIVIFIAVIIFLNALCRPSSPPVVMYTTLNDQSAGRQSNQHVYTHQPNPQQVNRQHQNNYFQQNNQQYNPSFQSQ